MRHHYFIVEGVHETEFIGKILSHKYKTTRECKKSNISEFWKPIIPNVFPTSPGEDICKRVHVPAFFQSDTDSVAIQYTSEIAPTSLTLEVAVKMLNGLQAMSCISIFRDADYQKPVETTYLELRQAVSAHLQLPSAAGEVATGNPRCGAFIFPDNSAQGTLEDILLECSQQSYKCIREAADTFISQSAQHLTPGKDRKDFDKPAGKNKAIIGAISSILRPGKAVQMSIMDNKWITNETIQLPRLTKFSEYLDKLFL